MSNYCESQYLTDDSNVEEFAFSEHCVECDFADLGPHCGLRQLRYGIFRVFDTVTGLKHMHTVTDEISCTRCDMNVFRRNRQYLTNQSSSQQFRQNHLV